MNCCCTRKLPKKTETEETIGFLVTFLLLVSFQLGGGGRLATPMPDQISLLLACSIAYLLLQNCCSFVYEGMQHLSLLTKGTTMPCEKELNKMP